MYISDLALNDFRSYQEVVLQLQPGVTTFIGENGQGKTNLIEAIGYLATFSSHRVAADVALVRQSASAAVIRAKVVHDDSPTVVELEILAGKANRARINRGNVKVRDLLGIVRTVLFAPEDLELVRGDPSARRNFLDSLMIQFKPSSAGIKSEYEKVLKQRAALLKSAAKIKRRGGIFDETSLDIWDAQFARLGAQLIAQRIAIIQLLRQPVQDFYQEVSGGKGIARIDYEANLLKRLEWQLPSPEHTHTDQALADIAARENELLDVVKNEKIMLQLLKKWRPIEIERGVNLVGPHRDDLRLTLGTLPAKGFASHGESWSYALALRLASWVVMREQNNDIWMEDDAEPILILDDVFAELDSRRRERLAKIISQAQQVFVTAAVGDDVPSELIGDRFWVEAGSVRMVEQP
ncbi:DNA replication/repair protein RecF [Arcanobacterium bovis]|uniref:DNA replication and repair protein RecF n=1 Tax=Arcanobacterium bovis TaxID=2529275 RepID=A0A4Q9V0P9_9ACTO|nr:DNA replication/repair protein RecF [Arcanobacterium bovis]TBW21036.1 DNA replication/repair protein RecF [Arcanobacterium bovis]